MMTTTVFSPPLCLGAGEQMSTRHWQLLKGDFGGSSGYEQRDQDVRRRRQHNGDGLPSEAALDHFQLVEVDMEMQTGQGFYKLAEDEPLKMEQASKWTQL